MVAQTSLYKSAFAMLNQSAISLRVRNDHHSGVMPHALQAASFFPTAKELSSGVQWFRDHPVLAAAAATAVSVITYLNALELQDAEDAAAAEDVPSRQRAPAPTRRKGSPSLSRKGSGALASDGKLSAAVSWCDEHGGSLTQVFEEETTPPLTRRSRRCEDSESDSEERDGVAERFEDAYQQHRTLSGGLRKSVTTQQLDVVAAAGSDSEVDTAQTESPQWGWYVPITPPQDQFHSTGREAVVAPCPVDVKVMRRTTSGQIP